jgi:REG-2-like HAD superfamily hydrolase
MATSPIKAVFLDAGNTLFTEHKLRADLYADIAGEFGGAVDGGRAKEAMALAFEELPQSIDGAFRFSLAWFRHFNGKVFSTLGVAESQMDTAHARTVEIFESPATYRVFDEVPALLEKLQALDLQIGIVSNWSEGLPDLCKGLGIGDKVDFIIASADVCAEKPDEAIYARALFRCGLSSEEVLHVGDRMDRDVRGALSAGIRAVYLDRKGQHDATREGIPVIRDLLGIIPHLETATFASSS